MHFLTCFYLRFSIACNSDQTLSVELIRSALRGATLKLYFYNFQIKPQTLVLFYVEELCVSVAAMAQELNSYLFNDSWPNAPKSVVPDFSQWPKYLQ